MKCNSCKEEVKQVGQWQTDSVCYEFDADHPDDTFGGESKLATSLDVLCLR